MTAPVLALTPGDPVGIGPEITAAVLHEYAGDDSVHGIAVADASVMRRAVEVLGLEIDPARVALATAELAETTGRKNAASSTPARAETASSPSSR